MAYGVKGHARITLKGERNKAGDRISSTHHGIIRPGCPIRRRDVVKHVVPVLAEVIRHHDIVVPTGGINRARNFGFRPGITVLIYFNVCPFEEGRVGVDLEPQHFSLGKHGTFTVKRCPMVRLHIFDKRFQVPGWWFSSDYRLSPKQGTEERNNGGVHYLEVYFHRATCLVRPIRTCQA